MTAPTCRLFLALWPAPATRRALAGAQQHWQWPAGALLTPADKLHLTLHFIGAVPAARVAAVAEGLALPSRRFTLVLDTAEVWPNRCAVLAARQVPPALAALHSALADRLRDLQLPVEDRAFRPHVTLARKAAGARPPEAPEAVRWAMRGHVLLQSAAGRYTPIARYT
ncbi:MAG: RNA 2',3'-cyclic phosphodiesterase [Aquincola sp.]|nr:RNA 2',3'-cyclic phosphodiesterase [Aquincola sp.]MDH4287126.1 RNA 2',3'-cyclic phosphodiesterase [Aquincola sp.]MDH5330199.1 RNA 2',3'-cyclic phosphodiesterase [Aquincola sp.]